MSDLKFLKKAVREAIAREKYGLLTESIDDELAAAQAAIRAKEYERDPESAAEFPVGASTNNEKQDPEKELNLQMENLHELIEKIEEMPEEEKGGLKMHVALGLFNIGTELHDKMQMLASKDSEVGPSADTQIVGKTTSASGEKTSAARPPRK